MIGRKRLHFGVVFANIDNTLQFDAWTGIVDYAHRNEIHLTAFMGTYQTSNNDVISHCESCFEIIRNSRAYDGVILFSGFIAGSIGNEAMEEFVAAIPGHIPLISVSYVIPGVPSIIIDNEAGMYGVVEHLIQAHGKRHIAFIKGPEGHPETIARFGGYKRALAASHIDFDERYVFPGNFSQEKGSLAVKNLLENTDISADAVVASDDLTAIGALRELKRQNIRVPDDISVTGFDDDRDSATFTPSISTVRQDFNMMGVMCARTLVDQINGKPPEPVVSMTPAFIARYSCGCPEKDHTTTDIYAEDYTDQNESLSLFDDVVMQRRVASNLVVAFDIDSLVEELNNSLPGLSIETVVIGLYKSAIKSGDRDADRSMDTFIGFDDNKSFKVKSDGTPLVFSDYLAIEEFNFDRQQRDLFAFPLFFRDDEYGFILVPYNSGISVNIYETLRVNISTAIKGAYLLKELEHRNAQLIKASNAKSDFLSTMSHEMRTPMNAIIGMTAIGKKATNIEEKNYTLNKIEDASTHLLNVINDVLDMAKIEANKFELSPIEFHFERMLQKVITVINYRVDEKEQTLSVNIDSRIPTFVIGDDKRLTQVLANLLSNAVKFTPEGGKIRLEASLIDHTDGQCELCMLIADDGIGISPEQQAHLFQAFKQAESGTSRNYGGTGLGLVISKNIIELMDGRIWVESELGKGAKFVFTIKVLEGKDDSHSLPASGQDEKKRLEHSEFIGKTVLLAEDIEINREILMALLEDSGLTIECAENGKEALDMVASAPDKYDIVFMDVQMPKMSGYEATRRIRALPVMRDNKLPIIAMTANVFKSDVDESIAAGMDGHLGKPLEIDKVYEVLRKYL